MSSVQILDEETDLYNIGRNNRNGVCNTGCNNYGSSNAGNNNLGSYNTGNSNHGYKNSGNCNYGVYNTGDGNCGVGGNTGDGNTGRENSGYYNDGSKNSGYFNKCDNSTGFFCSEEENVRLFNRPSNMKRSEFEESPYFKALCSVPFNLTEWVENSSKEDSDTPAKQSLGGHLKTYTYQEACYNWWNAMTQENRSIVMSMPNFDADVFYEITGIDLRKEHEKGGQA